MPPDPGNGDRSTCTRYWIFSSDRATCSPPMGSKFDAEFSPIEGITGWPLCSPVPASKRYSLGTFSPQF
jgi:hypothetical protein